MPWRGAQRWQFSTPLLPLPAFPWWPPLPVCALPHCVLCAQLVSDEILGFIFDKSQIYYIHYYLLIYANTIGLKKQKKKKKRMEKLVPVYSNGNIALYKAMEVKCLLYL